MQERDMETNNKICLGEVMKNRSGLTATPYDEMINHKVIVFFALNFHYYLFLLASLLRMRHYRSLGRINLMESKPKSYKVKLTFQIFMTLGCILMVVDWDFIDGGYSFDALSLIYLLYAGVWILSIYLQFFEY